MFDFLRLFIPLAVIAGAFAGLVAFLLHRRSERLRRHSTRHRNRQDRKRIF